MAEKLTTALAGFALLIASASFAGAEEGKFDKSIAMAAAEKAAGRMGEMRGSIDHDAQPEIVTPERLRKKADHETSLLPRPAWQPVAESKPLPPMVNLDDPHVDTMMTGSIRRNRKVRESWPIQSEVGLDDPYIDTMMTGSVRRDRKIRESWPIQSEVGLDDPYIETMMTGSVRRNQQSTASQLHPPIVSVEEQNIDPITIGSIRRDRKVPVNVPKPIQWERFDSKGRLIKP